MERALVLKALIDPEFRRAVEDGSAGLKETTRLYILTAVKSITAQITSGSDLLLCKEPPPGPVPC